MKIVFNCLNSGLANNGGSRTVIRCAQTIEKLGYKCDIAATSDNFNWFEHKPPVPYIPWDADVVVATACTTVASTLASNIKKKAWYIRGHESWMWDEDVLAKLYNNELFKITNSNGLKRKIESLGGSTVVIPQGIDFDWWNDEELQLINKMRIGCLYQKKKTKRWKDFVKLAELLGHDGYEYVGFGDTMRDDGFLTSFLCEPTVAELRNLYSTCHVWFAPTELEGLHNVPMEAALSGALIVCSDSPMNGMMYDYAFDGQTAIVYPQRDIEYAADAIERCDWAMEYMVPNMQSFIRTQIGSREYNMQKFVGILENI